MRAAGNNVEFNSEIEQLLADDIAEEIRNSSSNVKRGKQAAQVTGKKGSSTFLKKHGGKLAIGGAAAAGAGLLAYNHFKNKKKKMIIKRTKTFGFFGNLFKSSPVWNRFDAIPDNILKKFLKAEKEYPEIITVWNEEKVNNSGDIKDDLISQGSIPVVSFCKTPKVNLFTIWYDPKEKNWVCRDSRGMYGWKWGKSISPILKTVLGQMEQFGFMEEADKISKVL